jgi:hypothetical protein
MNERETGRSVHLNISGVNYLMEMLQTWRRSFTLSASLAVDLSIPSSFQGLINAVITFKVLFLGIGILTFISQNS